MFQKIRHLFIIVTIFLSYLNSIAQKPCGYIAKVCAENGMNSVETDQAIDVTNYHIKLTIASFSNKTISGSTVVSFKVGNTNISSCQLMLEGLTVDSVVYNSNTLSFSHIDNILTSNFPSPLSAGYSAQIEVFYSGKPIRDATWGGFYFVDEYAFNLGVGFTSNPHNYGRVWFPCKDDFTDRATYQFDITTTTDKKAVCNGILLETIINTDQTLTYKWLMQDEIPTYLASFAVAPYTFTQYTHKGIPVLLSSVLSDSANMAASFENLPGCIEAYLKFYGTHTFSRIGFNAVPFNGGAMEHATNIAYPIFGITGDKAYETLYAHELAHHWWGNTVTCADATDMWINEGWASFSERLFLEWVYGTARYKEDISNNHWAVLHHAHIRDKDTLPVAGIGHDQTYGSHVYDKGADMVHTLRGYMGDEQFFKAVQSFLVDYKFKSVTTAILQTHFQNYTQVNLAPFFDQWIRKKGFVHFDVIDQQTSGNASTGFSTKLKLRQRLRFTTDLYTDVPMEITFMSADFQKQTSTHLLSNYITEVEIKSSFKPSYVALDFNEKLSDAITDKYYVVKDTGTFDFKDAMMMVHVTEIADSTLIRVEHHWVGGDAYFATSTLPVLSKERYWTVDGIGVNSLKSSAVIEYNGRNSGILYDQGYYDNGLIKLREDSLVLMYRTTTSSPWVRLGNYTHNMGSPYDRRGSFTIHQLKAGEYCFGMNDAKLLNISPNETMGFDANIFKVYPNPTEGILHISYDERLSGIVEITNSNGQVILSQIIKNQKLSMDVDTTFWSKGIYFIGLVKDGKSYESKAVLVR